MHSNPYRVPATLPVYPAPAKAREPWPTWAFALVLGVVSVCGALALTGCPGSVPIRPAAYGTELAVCLEQSATWHEYEPCCADVAKRYGRDTGFCYQGFAGTGPSATPAAHDGGAK